MSDSKIRTETLTLRNPSATGVRPGCPRPVLIVVQGEELGRRYVIGEHCSVLGREPGDGELAIADPGVSARHARIEANVREESYTIIDLGSRNGTYVNGSAVAAHALSEGDKIWLGSTVLKFTFHDSIEERFHGELDRLISEDSLSGLYQRRWVDIEYPKAFAQARSSNAHFSVLMMDMDGLKGINDAHGHLMGSHCIAEVGKLIKGCLRAAAAGARFGGDEFMAFVPDVELDDAIALADEIRRRVESFRFPLPPGVRKPTISIGVAALSPAVTTPDDLMRLADDALYRAKKKGGNTVCA